MILRMAWRNLWSHRRRTLVTIAAISIGLALAVFSIGLGDGGHGQMIENAVKMGNGHITILAPGYLTSLSPEQHIAQPERLIGPLEGVENVREVHLRLEGQGLLSSTAGSVGVGFKGVDPAEKIFHDILADRIVAGGYLTGEKRGEVIIGSELARRLEVKPGKKVVLMSQDSKGEIGSQLLRVKGVFETGTPDLDGYLCLLTLDDARRLLALESDSGVTHVAVYLDNVYRQEETLAAIRALLIGDRSVEVQPWQALMPDLVDFVLLDDAGNYLFLGIILVIVALGVLNTILMSVLERTREFGVMLALGMKPYRLFVTVILETALLAAISLAAGGILGYGILAYFAAHGLDLAGLSEETLIMGGTVLDPVLYPELRPGRLQSLALVVFSATMLMGLYPAFKATRVTPVEAIQKWH